VIDRVPRLLDDEEGRPLHDLARLTERELAATGATYFDELTGLTCRQGFLELGRHVLATCRRSARPAMVLRFDLKGLALINAEHSHAEGDLALRRLAGVMREVFRDSDALARLGGDGFAVLLSGALAATPARFEAVLAAADAADGRGYSLRVGTVACRFERFRHAEIEDLVRESDVTILDYRRLGAALG
jgi:diguanylate cyclase (GGDEF)-like protein